ncbi:hypothetical protein CsatA_004442 [Cannabis sativa]
MSKLFSRVAGFFSNRTKMGVDKAGNRYFARKEEIDGVLKEKRWVIFKGEDDPTSIPVEWICWLNGQRKKAPTSEEREEMEARRERVRLNVALMKKEEEERKLKEGSTQKGASIGQLLTGPDLSSFIRQFPGFSEGIFFSLFLLPTHSTKFLVIAMNIIYYFKYTHISTSLVTYNMSSEPTGSGQTYKPGTWQPPT